MRTGTKLMIAAVYLPLALAVLFLVTYDPDEGRGADPSLDEELKSYVTIRNLIKERYVEDPDTRALFYEAMKGMIEPLEYSRFYPPEKVADFDEEITGQYVGLGLTVDRREDKLFVRSLFFGSPAAKHLSVGDEILVVEGTPVADIAVKELAGMMRGDAGSICVLEVRRAATHAVVEVAIAREKISEPSVTPGILIDEKNGIGYIAVSRFHEHTFKEFKHAMEKLDEGGLKSLVLDVRFNTGGVLDSAVLMANLFIPSGLLVRTEGRHPGSRRDYTAKRNLFAYPDIDLVILVNKESASAAEVLAGTLQDHGRATLLGAHTFGKGVVQSAMKVELFGEPVYLKIPIALYFLPSGRSIESRIGKEEAGGGGLEPDISVALPSEDREKVRARINDLLLGRETAAVADAQLEAAMNHLK